MIPGSTVTNNKGPRGGLSRGARYFLNESDQGLHFEAKEGATLDAYPRN